MLRSFYDNILVREKKGQPDVSLSPFVSTARGNAMSAKAWQR